MTNQKISYEDFKDILNDMRANGSKEDRALAKDYLKHVEEQEKTAAREKRKQNKVLSAHELIVELTEMLDVGSRLAASLKTSAELPFAKSYKNAPAKIRADVDKVAANLGKYRESFKDWYLKTAYAISRYEKNTYHLHEFISNRNRYVIVRSEHDEADELLADFGHHITELVKILKVLEKHDTTLAISLGFDGSGKPHVTIGEEVLQFKTMRNGHAFNMISYCLKYKPSTPMSLDELKKAEGLKLSGVSNINQALRNSPFDVSDGLLKVFVESSPQSLTVKPTVNVTPEYLDKLRDETLSTN